MSLKAITWAKDQRVGNPLAKLILLILADYANEDGESWPRQSTIADQAECSREAVNRNLKALEEAGFVSKRVKSKSGARTEWFYIMPCDSRSHSRVTEDHSPCDAGSLARVTQDHTVYNDEPPVEPSKEPTPPVVPPFERFWKAYPSRGSHSNPKHPAKLKFDAAVKRGVDPDEIIAGAMRYAATITGKDQVFVCQAVTWLNQRRWLDEYDQDAPPDGWQASKDRVFRG